MRMPWSKKTDAEREKEQAAKAKAEEDYKAKIQAMRDSIARFKKELSEEFILGNNMASVFQECFGPQLGKKGSSATKRWCQDVTKKLQKLDKSNKEFSESHCWTRSDKAPCGIRLQDNDKATLKAKSLKEFKKIFYNTKAFDSTFLGTEVKVKATLSQRAAVNEFKKELNELCDPENFKPKS